MANKWYGKIGFETTEEISPGVWMPRIKEEFYYGDFVKRGSRWQNSSDSINDNKGLLNMTLSIVADAFAMQEFHQIKYVVWAGVKWKVSSIEILYPRLILSLGDKWNEDETGTS